MTSWPRSARHTPSNSDRGIWPIPETVPVHALRFGSASPMHTYKWPRLGWSIIDRKILSESWFAEFSEFPEFPRVAEFPEVSRVSRVSRVAELQSFQSCRVSEIWNTFLTL